MTRRRARVLLTLASVLVAPAAEAQGAKPDTAARLSTVTVTATRSNSAILTTPLAVTKISAPALRSLSGYGLDEALGRVPGVLAQSRYGTSDIRLVIRGFGARGAGDRSNAGTSRGVRILLDGIPETEPDGRTSMDQIDLAAASSIEVIRSNASAIWGNAAGGVVNVLSPIWNDTPTLELQPIAGSFGLKRLALRTSAPAGDGTAYLSYTNTTSDGWRDHSSSRRALVNAGFVGAMGDKTKVGFYVSGANNLFRIPGALTKAQADADPSQANATYASRDERRYNRVLKLGATVDRSLTDQLSLTSMLYVNPKYLQRSERNTFRDFTRYHVGGNLIGHAKMGGSHLTVGVDEAYQDGAILFYSLVNGERGTELRDNKSEGANNFGAFVQDEMSFGTHMIVTAGARLDRIAYYNKNFIDPTIDADKAFKQVTPKLGVVWMLGDTRSLYANLGGGIEVPAGNEVDPFEAQGNTSVNVLLEPIKSTTVEAGFKSISEALGPVTLSGDVAVYSTSVKNDLQPYNEGRFYMSAGKSRRTGLELGLGADTKSGVFGSLGLTASSNKYLTYSIDSSLFKVGGGTAVFDDNKIVGIPGMMAQLELGTTIPGMRGVRVKAGLEHIGKYFADDANKVEVPAYSIVNFTAELAKPIATENGWGIRGFISVRNLTDKKYIGSAFLNPLFDASGAPIAFEPGAPRSVVVSVSVGRLR